MRNPSSSSSSEKSGKKTAAGGWGNKVVKKGPWTAEEDEILSSYIKREGEGKWRTLPKRAGLLRCGKSCRLRWMNYLRPSVKRGHIAADEEDLILRMHRLLGNRWSLIAGRIPGRTDNEIKNYWNTHLSKKLISQGIDPTTHKPLHHLGATTTTSTSTNHHKPPSSSSPSIIKLPTPPKPPSRYEYDDLPSLPIPCTSSCSQNDITPPPPPPPPDDYDQHLHREGKLITPMINNRRDHVTFEGDYDDHHHDYRDMVLMMKNCYTTSSDDHDQEEDGGDAAFSSFLNSLINEQEAAHQEEQLQQASNTDP